MSHRHPPTPPISWWEFEESRRARHDKERDERHERERHEARTDPRQVDWVQQFQEQFEVRR